MSRTAIDTERRQTLHALFRKGTASTRNILRADFATWPPQGLAVTETTDPHTKFSTFFTLTPAFKGYVANATPQTININRWTLLPCVFNQASDALADTISHENIHVLQNSHMRTISTHPEKDPPNSYREYITNIIPPYYFSTHANMREFQARLHGVVTEHYRRRNVLPLNTPELWAFLRSEKIVGKSAYIDKLLKTPPGKWAKEKFPEGSGKRGSRLQDSADLWLLFHLVRDDMKDAFYKKIVPGVYGRLLELYGDKFGCMRMDYNYNTLTNETIFRQAGANDRDGLAKTIDAMPLSQAGALLNDLMRDGSWMDKTTGNIHKATPETANILTDLLYNHTKPRDYRRQDLQIRP